MSRILNMDPKCLKILYEKEELCLDPILIVRKSDYFDEKWYLLEYPELTLDWQGHAYEHYATIGWKEYRNPGAYFDTWQYCHMYCVGEYSNWNPLVHYEVIGKKEGITPPITPYIIIKRSAFFHKFWYRFKYMHTIKGDAVRHYLKEGWQKGFNPGRKFDGNKYLKEYPDVANANVCPLFHYERWGKFEARRTFSEKEPEYKKKSIIWHIFQKIILLIVKIILPRKILEKKILVVAHIFYPEAWPEIEEYLKNLSIYQYDLYVSFINDLNNRALEERIASFNSRTHFLHIENRGFDIGSFFEVINNVNLDNYDIVFKIHSKGIKRQEIYIYERYFKGKEWFSKLFRGVLGIINAHISVLKLSRNNDVGMVGARELIVKDPEYKQNLLREWCQKLGLDCPKDYRFIAGTCFGVKASLLRRIQMLNLGIECFDISTRGEFSLAHALERILCSSVQDQGYRISGNITFSIMDLVRKYQAHNKRKNSVYCLLDDQRFKLDDNFFFRILESKSIRKYEVIKMPIKDIIRIWNGKKLSLKDCAPYYYLKGNKEIYQEYCSIHKESNLPLMSEERYKELIDSIERNGFDRRYMIVVNQDNVLQDGQHRACYLLYKYGEDYEADVLKLYFCE